MQINLDKVSKTYATRENAVRKAEAIEKECNFEFRWLVAQNASGRYAVVIFLTEDTRYAAFQLATCGAYVIA